MRLPAVLQAPRRLVWLFCLALLSGSFLALFLAEPLRGTNNFLPHVYCYLYNRNLIALHVVSDGAIWLSYVGISITLAYLVYRTRREIPFSWMFLAFGTFIIACGFTHLMEVIVLWQPLYWLAGNVKLLTALASVVTALALPPLVPHIHQMVQDAHVSEERRRDLERGNRDLASEVDRRLRAEDELRALSATLLHLQDEERRRLARELHDSVGQLVASAQLNLCSIESQDNEIKPAAKETLADTGGILSQALQEIRTISHLLHPPMLDDVGLNSALRWYVEGFQTRSGIRADVNIANGNGRLPRPVETTIFRIAQEALSNIHRHSGARTARVNLTRQESRVRLEVFDDGKGMEGRIGAPQSDGRNFGVGLRGMAERVRQLGGKLDIQSDSSGTRISVELPISDPAARAKDAGPPALDIDG